MSSQRFLTLSSAVVLSMAFAVPERATAQTAQEEKAGYSGLDEIVVTARRREEAITDVPISITALSGEALMAKGVDRVDDLQVSTPSLKTAPTAGRRSNSQYELRGITTIESLITEDSAVGVYVNDVYRARPTGTNQTFYDIGNVQVLYGPQGTLFGRNSTGGAILINTNRPTDRWEGSIEVGAGNLDRREITGVLNAPVSDVLQVRLAAQMNKTDGYVTNVTSGNKLGGTDTKSGRLSVLFKPTDAVENLFVGSVYDADDEGTPNVLYGLRTSSTPNQYGQVPALSALAGLANAAFANAQALGHYRTALDGVGATIPGLPSTVGLTGYFLQGTTLENRDPHEEARNYSVSNATTIQLNDTLTLKNIAGYNYIRLNASTDLDGTPIKLVDTYYHTVNNQLSNEIQLLGEADRFNWVVGGLWFREKGTDYQPSVQFIQAFGVSTLKGTNTSAGLFAQGTYKITDKLNATAGARYTWDKREYDMHDSRSFPGSAAGVLANNGGLGFDLGATAVCNLKAGVPNAGPCRRTDSEKYDEPSYTLSLDYKPTQETLVYIAHRHGYRAGGFNSRVTASAPAAQQLAQTQPFRPETIDDIEIGFKGDFQVGDTSFRSRVSVYKDWYDDIQKQITSFVGGSGITIITNAGKARVKGLEAQFGVAPLPWLDLDLFYGHVDGEYKDFPVPNSTTGAVVPSVPFATSKHTGGATLTLTPIDNDAIGRVSLASTYSYRSSYFGDNALPTLNPEAHIPSQRNLNFDLTWANVVGSNFSITGWVKNATDQKHYLGLIDLVPTFGVAVATVGEPRTYGVTAKYSFGD